MYSAHLVRDGRFWKVSVLLNNSTIVTYGHVGSKGRSSKRSFADAAEAEQFAKFAADDKVNAGYAPVDAEETPAATDSAPSASDDAPSASEIASVTTKDVSAAVNPPSKRVTRSSAKAAANPVASPPKAKKSIVKRKTAKPEKTAIPDSITPAASVDSKKPATRGSRATRKPKVEPKEESEPDVTPAPPKAKKSIVKRKTARPEPNVIPDTITPAASANSKKPAKRGKRAAKQLKAEPEEESEPDITPAAAAPMQSTAPAATLSIPVDGLYPNANKAEVVGDYDATLNQTNITGANNNNKYYKLQLLQVQMTKTPKFFVWTRWGRVGEAFGSSTQEQGPYDDAETAIPVFEKKFQSKTGNKWENRANFVPKAKKYDLVAVDYTKKEDAHVDAFAAMDAAAASGGASPEKVEYLPSKLEPKTENLVKMLFEKELYSNAMKDFDIDTRRMPLGQLTAAQILRGIDVLKEIETALQPGQATAAQLDGLSSRFYSVIPHDFGRQRPPPINHVGLLQKGFDKCNVLLDIEKATKLMADADKRKQKVKVKKELVPHPTDGMYDSLNANLSVVDQDSAEYGKVLRAFQLTSESGYGCKLLDVWRVDRHGEDKRFAKFDKLDNHKLLWHGTNVAVVAAILSSGLRIMPHSGGRCGAGIYLASEAAKSQGYTRPDYKSKIGCMFLAEAALGKEFSLMQDDSSLRNAPAKFDSVVARGRQGPAKYEEILFGDRKVMLPVSKPISVPSHSNSSFHQDEYLVYREDQVRLRYVLSVKF